MILVLELIIEYFLGTMLVKLLLKREGNPCMNVLTGFMAEQALFQILTLAVVFTTRVLHHLTITWAVVLCILVPFSFWYGRDIMKRQIYGMIAEIRKRKGVVLLFLLVIAAFCYYTSVNGEQNDDACYYIGLMTTTVETDSLFQYNAYTGQQIESFYLRRAVATFEIHSAVLSQMTGIHPLPLARIFRACQNVILTSVAVFACSNALFWRKEIDAVEKSLLTTVAFWGLQMAFANTIYTPARFLLYRTYEAKAFTSNLVVLFGLYLCVKFLRERDKRYFLLLGIFIWGSMALSTSAIVVAGIECMILLIPVLVQERLHAS